MINNYIHQCTSNLNIQVNYIYFTSTIIILVMKIRHYLGMINIIRINTWNTKFINLFILNNKLINLAINHNLIFFYF